MLDPLRLLTSLASPGGVRGRLLTFFFHRVLAEPDPMQPGEMDARRFDQTLTWIGEQFNVLHPLEACERLKAGTLPARAAIISFDDGYRDNHDVALPLLRQHGMTAVFFVATGYLGNGVQFNDRLREAFRVSNTQTVDFGWMGLERLATHDLGARLGALDRVREAVKYMGIQARMDVVARIERELGAVSGRPGQGRVMMTPEEVQVLARNGMEIGGHTVMHPILRVIDDEAAYAEIHAGRCALVDILGYAPRIFSYPNGKLAVDFEMRHAAMARQAGFEFAFSTQRGAASATSNMMVLPRFMPWHTTPGRFKAQALRVLVN